MNTSAQNRYAQIRPDTAVLCTTIVIAPQLFGGAFPWAVVAIAGMSLIALATALWTRRPSATVALDGVLIMMGVAWLWTCLQAVPLPTSIAQALGLGSVESAERLQGLDWASAIQLTISHDPGATHVQILIGIAILASFLAARLGGPEGLQPIAIAAVVSALLIGLVGLAHRAVGTEVLFGVYSPRFIAPELLTPLMNGNHLGGFSLMGALIAAGLAAQGDRRSRHAWATASALCTILVAWTVSRGAIGSLLFGFVLLAGWFSSRRRPDRRGAAIPIAVVGAALAGLLAFASLEPILRRFESQGFDKLETALRGFDLLHGSAWWLGVGRGAFSAAFVANVGSTERYTHPENLVTQWTTEWGVPVAVALLVVLVVAVWQRLRNADKPITAAVCVAIIALSLQNLVDFSLEMAGIVVVVASLLGALLTDAERAESRSPRRWPLTAFSLFVVILAVLGPRVLRSDTQSVVDQLVRSMQDDDEKTFEATLRRGLALHPSEPSLALLAGTYAGLKRHSDAPQWLAVVMDEAPGWAAPHVVAAKWLFAEGRTDQALIEIREAELRQPNSGHAALCNVLARFPNMDHVERAAPSKDVPIDYWGLTARCPGLDPALRQEIDTLILRHEPTRPGSVLRESSRLIARDQTDQAVDLLRRALAHHEDDANLWLALIGALLNAEDPAEARLALEQAKSRGLANRALLAAQARVEAGLGETDEMRATILRLRGQSRGDARSIARSFMLEGELEASLGNVDRALTAYEAADEANPATPALQQAAALALRSGRRTRARRMYGRLCLRKPEGPACAQEALLSKDSGQASPAGSIP